MSVEEILKLARPGSIAARTSQASGAGKSKPAKPRKAKGKKGVVLFSGGLDSVGLAILAKRQGYDLTPVFMSHRANVGNVTKKELTAARELAKRATGNTMVVFKPKAKRLADWYGPAVQYTTRLPVPAKRKNWRNRIFLDVLKDAGLADGIVLVGVFGGGERAAQAGRASDVSKKGLSAYLKKIGGKGTVLTAEDFGTRDKEAVLRAVGNRKRTRELLTATESCLMYFAKPCGNCWSCVDRAEAFQAAGWEDKTGYRPKSTAGRLAKG